MMSKSQSMACCCSCTGVMSADLLTPHGCDARGTPSFMSIATGELLTTLFEIVGAEPLHITQRPSRSTWWMTLLCVCSACVSLFRLCYPGLSVARRPMITPLAQRPLLFPTATTQYLLSEDEKADFADLGDDDVAGILDLQVCEVGTTLATCREQELQNNRSPTFHMPPSVLRIRVGNSTRAPGCS